MTQEQALPIMFDADLEIDDKLHPMHAWMRFSPAGRDVNQLLGFRVMLCTNFVGFFSPIFQQTCISKLGCRQRKPTPKHTPHTVCTTRSTPFAQKLGLH
jgi:hypothetical protein